MPVGDIMAPVHRGKMVSVQCFAGFGPIAVRVGRRQVGFIAVMQDEMPVLVPFQMRCCGQQMPGIGVAWPLKQLPRCCRLHDLAAIHHHDAVADAFDHRKIMADEQAGKSEPVAQIAQQIEDLRLHGHVEGRNRLVRDHEFGLRDQRAGNGDALALTARKLVRKPVAEFGTQPDGLQHRVDAPRGRRAGQHALAESLDLPLSDIIRRVDALDEANPMLGMRGVRLGITFPEIYDMQARAIFEATIASAQAGAPIVPEIMLPLVSARREVEIVKTRIDQVAAAVRTESHEDFNYRLGVMVETPRACLRAGDIAQYSDFISFGTNDLTQMTYGLSRDDAGRFMGTYVSQHVYEEDPFHILDREGVGELVLTGSRRARQVRPAITLSICGEHGGNPESIAFCHGIGMDYVSCSPFRVPVARLATAQLAINARRRASISADSGSRG